MLLTLVTLAFLCTGLPVSAAEFVVDPDGTGDATTIQGGLDLAGYGDVVLVMPGTYEENVTMISGVALTGVAGAEATIIDGNNDFCILCNYCSVGTLIEGFTLADGGGHSGGGVRVFGNSHVEIANCVIRNNHTYYDAAGIVVQNNCYAYIHDNEFRDNVTLNSTAIAVIVNSEATIEHNLFRGNVSTFLSSCIGLNAARAWISGNVFMENQAVNGGTIHTSGGNTDATIENNTFLNNHATDGASGIYCYGGSSMIANNNIFAFNTGQPAVKNDANLEAGCNDFWQNDAHYQGPGNIIGQNGNFIADPLFCDVSAESAALAETSPCLIGPCGVIGANPVPECDGPVVTEQMSWSLVKSMYR